MRKYFSYLLIGIFSACTVLLIQSKISSNKIHSLLSDKNSDNYSVPAAFASLNGALPSDAFVTASELSAPTVVHITTKAKTSTINQGNNPMDLFEYFFGEPMPNQKRQPNTNKDDGAIVPLGSGSGVIVSSDGYIVTNNHVIEGAEEIEVVLHDNRSYKATLIGVDPNTDLALIKIESCRICN